jgi:GTP-binding protein EngB required for normal cell division
LSADRKPTICSRIMSATVPPFRSFLLAVCGSAAQFPPASLPEIALAGRSNVGKDQLLHPLPPPPPPSSCCARPSCACLSRVRHTHSVARSNSRPGKSSLLNSLAVPLAPLQTGVSPAPLAKCSGTPGRTQTINFYGSCAGRPRALDKSLDGSRPNLETFRLVDLPGYGAQPASAPLC